MASLPANLVPDDPMPSPAMNNTGFGVQALANLTNSWNNSAFGYRALNAVSTLQQTSHNTGIGAMTLQSLQSGSGNVGVGACALQGAQYQTSGTTALGHKAMAYLQGTDNTVLGALAMTGIPGVALGPSGPFAVQNTVLGASAARILSTGQGNLLAGYEVGYSPMTSSGLSSGSYNVVLGQQAGANLGTASQTVIVGANAGQMNASSGSVLIGYQAGVNNAIGLYQTLIGYQAGYLSNPGGNYDLGNTLLGYQAGYYPSTSSGLTVGIGNVLIGQNAGGSLGDSGDNVMIGALAGQQIQGDDNVIMGAGSGIGIASGYENVILGSDAGSSVQYSNLDNYSNVMIGYSAGYNTSSGTNFNVFIGTETGQELINGSSNNVIIGYEAGAVQGSTCNSNVVIGSNAGGEMTSASDMVLIGDQAGLSLTSSGTTVAIGSNALNTVSGALVSSNNLIMGTQAGQNLSGNIHDCVMIGYQACGYLYNPPNYTTGDYNVVMGSLAGAALTTGGFNTVLGTYAGSAFMEDSTQNISIGFASDCYGTTVDPDIYNPNYDSTSPNSSIAIGTYALALNQYGNSICVGNSAQSAVGWGSQRELGTILIGNNVTNGTSIIGNESETSTSQNQVVIGHNVVCTGTASSAPENYPDQVIIGNFAQGECGNQVLIGNYASGYNNPNDTEGPDQIIIGNSSSLPATQSYNSIIMGHDSNIYCDATIAMGHGVLTSSGTIQISIGNDSVMYGDTCIALGNGTLTNGGNQQILIGHNGSMLSTNSIAMGHGILTSGGAQQILIGNGITAPTGSTDSLLIGHEITGTQAGQVVLGNYASCTGDNSIVIGHGASTSSGNMVQLGAIQMDLLHNSGESPIPLNAAGTPTGFTYLPLGNAIPNNDTVPANAASASALAWPICMAPGTSSGSILAPPTSSGTTYFNIFAYNSNAGTWMTLVDGSNAPISGPPSVDKRKFFNRYDFSLV